MSREEIDRILTDDIDSHVTQHIQTIDQITDQLALKSNFLAQFQLLLQQELSHTHTKDSSIVPQQAVLVESSARIEQSVAIPEQLQQISENLVVAAAVHSDTDHNHGQQYDMPKFKDASVCCQHNPMADQLRRQVAKCLSIVLQTKMLYNQFAENFKQIVFATKKSVMEIAQDQVQMIADQLKRQYRQQLSSVTAENSSLKQQLQLLQNQSTPLKELTFNKLNIDQSIYKQIQISNTPDQLSTNTVQPKIQSFPIKTKRNRHSKQNVDYQPTYRAQYQQQTKYKQNQTTTIPTIKPITIGVPPVRQGFGTLKYHSRTIYKGMWSNGKFEGKGTLDWDNYTYIGQFKQGVFSGYGILQTQGMVYTGRFQNNKAEGEGTLQMHSIKKCGLWSSNELIRQY